MARWKLRQKSKKSAPAETLKPKEMAPAPTKVFQISQDGHSTVLFEIHVMAGSYCDNREQARTTLIDLMSTMRVNLVGLKLAMIGLTRVSLTTVNLAMMAWSSGTFSQGSTKDGH